MLNGESKLQIQFFGYGSSLNFFGQLCSVHPLMNGFDLGTTNTDFVWLSVTAMALATARTHFH